MRITIQSINRWISQSINQSMNQSINQSIDESVNQSINQSIDGMITWIKEKRQQCDQKTKIRIAAAYFSVQEATRNILLHTCLRLSRTKWYSNCDSTRCSCANASFPPPTMPPARTNSTLRWTSSDNAPYISASPSIADKSRWHVWMRLKTALRKSSLTATLVAVSGGAG